MVETMGYYESSAAADLTVDGYQIMFSPWLKPWVRYESSATADLTVDGYQSMSSRRTGKMIIAIYGGKSTQ
jgi:hypothetical protein